MGLKAKEFLEAERVLYMIENKTNGKKYIGMTVDYEKRKKQHFYNLRNPDKHVNKKLQRDFDEGTWDDFHFSVIKTVKGLEEAHEEESRLIKLFDTMENGYNASVDTKFNIKHIKHSRERKYGKNENS